MINLERIKQKKCQPPLLRRPDPAPYFHPLFLIFEIHPLRGEVIKIHFPPIKRGGGVPSYLYPLHIHNLAIFRALECLETKAYSKLCETLTGYIQNPAIVRIVYSGVIQSYSDIFRPLNNTCMCRNLAYSESWNIQKPGTLKTRYIFRTLSKI